ncbi:homoserine O-acetyltransferase [Penicillium bovifimosum]|uniref:Homoserine O-acetyltransferase n=1 Tax=Penicillium bovifimosum TaxID=126998 RepID=A0A9W9L4Z0_9EURO|nr:homoserine O-acetyltransferase [Penicillium bovifimosum]KAJ5138898.1 homoserine O-acetyltransferase [Penicillium bovifimosum]
MVEAIPNMKAIHSRLFIPQFTLESGTTLYNVPVAYSTYGSLNAKRDNVIVICHGFSAGTQVMHWWNGMIGTHRALNPSKYFIICLNALGSPFGSASPLTAINEQPSLGPYGPAFPLATIRDDVRIHKQVLDRMDIDQIQCVIGGSMGGMAALEWAYLGAQKVRSFVSIAASARLGAWAISWNEVQRHCIASDPAYNNGHYDSHAPPIAGLMGARMAGLLTYRSRNSYEARFGRELAAYPTPRSSPCSTPESSAGSTDSEVLSEEMFDETPPFLTQTYIRYNAGKFCATFDANCYIALTHKLDTHDITRGRVGSTSRTPLADALGQLMQPGLVVGISSDILYPPQEQKDIAAGLRYGEYRVIVSDDGHDGFLLHTEELNSILMEFLDGVRDQSTILG